MKDAHELSAPASPGKPCVRCGALFDPNPDAGRVLYCETCVRYFKEFQAKENAKNHGTNFHAIPAGQVRPGSRPLTAKDAQTRKVYCGLCGSDDVSDEYGASCYGIGTFTHCRACGGVLDFLTDDGR